MSTSDAPDSPSTVGSRYRALLDIGRTLAGTLSLPDVYEAVYRETASVLEAPGFFISQYDPHTDQARVVFYVDQGEVRHDVDIKYLGADSEVLREASPVLIADRLDERGLAEVGDAAAETTRSAISAPMSYKGRLLGTVSAQSYRPDAYVQDDLDLLQGIADIAGVAIDNALHIRELDERRREAEMVEEIGRAVASSLDPSEVLGKVVEAVAEVLAVDGAAVWLREQPDEEQARPSARVAASRGEITLPAGLVWRLSEDLAERIVRDRSPVVVENVESSPLIPDVIRDFVGPGSGVGVPLVVGGEVAGFLSAAKRETNHFTGADVTVLSRLAGQAAVALENARLHADLQALSLTDALTGLPNRRHLEIHLRKEVAAARRGRSLVVVIFDLDGFKKYNDTLGHLAGDEILRSFAQVLSQENRAMNMVARYGGDEFVSLLSDTHLDGARRYARRVATALQRSDRLVEHGVSVSVGLAEFDQSTMKTAEDVLQAADDDMYREKAAQSGPAGSRLASN